MLVEGACRPFRLWRKNNHIETAAVNTRAPTVVPTAIPTVLPFLGGGCPVGVGVAPAVDDVAAAEDAEAVGALLEEATLEEVVLEEVVLEAADDVLDGPKPMVVKMVGSAMIKSACRTY